MSRRTLVVVPVVLALLFGLLPSAYTTTYGDLEFPRDEHQHVTGWDYWWGAADLTARSGNRYTVGFAFNSHYGVGVSGHQVFPRQGPYEGLSIMTMDGPVEWGHAGEPPGRYLRNASTYVPGVSDLFRFETFDTSNAMKNIGSLERTSLEHPAYRLRLDNDEAKVHPTNDKVKLLVDLHAEMRDPPLLAGGTGTWWYGIPETYGYPSRSFQYMQSARTLTGTLELEQPDGSLLRETVVPRASTLVLTHEYDATPEDLYVGLALAESTQLHPRYPQYFQGGWPWELFFIDLRNGAQLMVAALGFHHTQRGTLTPVVGANQPTYRVLATLRLQSGASIELDEAVRVEHLSYRTQPALILGIENTVKYVWTQAWTYRLSYAGGSVQAPDGAIVKVPSFDLGLVPQFDADEPAPDERGNRQTQRVPFVARGSYAGCPAHGFAWSELLLNWNNHEDADPWFTGGDLPVVPKKCDRKLAQSPSGQPGDLTPPPQEEAPIEWKPESCSAPDDNGEPTCSYDATIDGGIGGFSNQPGEWTVTITRPGKSQPLVVRALGGFETYPCGTIRAGDHVVATAAEGASVTPGNPGICY